MAHADILDRLGGPSAVARDLGKKPGTVWVWQRRGIPANAWVDIERIARQRGIDDITVQTLHATRPAPAQPEDAAA